MGKKVCGGNTEGEGGAARMTKQRKRIILDRSFIMQSICINCSQDGRCDYQSIYPVPACATVDHVEDFLTRLHE